MIKKSFSEARRWGSSKGGTIRFVKRRLHRHHRHIARHAIRVVTDFEDFDIKPSQPTSAWDIS